MTRLTRIRTVAAVLLVTLAVALTGCGASSSVATADPAAVGDSVEAGAFPVTIRHEFGSTTITSAPKRVVVVGLVEQDALLALGTVSVAVTDWFGNAPGRIFPWAKHDLGSAPVPQVLPAETDFEKIAALRPDLIVALYAGLKAKDYQLLSAIAPTIAHPAGQNDYSISWQQVTRIVGRAVGRPAAADKLVAGVNAKFAAARRAYPQFQGKQALMVTPYEGIFVYGPQDPRGRLLAQLGFTFPPGFADVVSSGYGASISAENADEIDVDALVWLGSENKVEKAIPTYARLDVARRHRAVYVPENDDDPFYVATSFVTVLSLPYLLDRLTPPLAKALDEGAAPS